MSDYLIGQSVWWFKSMRQGNCTLKIPALIYSINRLKLGIKYVDHSGSELIRYVPRESVQKRDADPYQFEE